MPEDNAVFPSPDEIQGWCSLAAGGDRQAVERLLSAHHRRLLGFVRRKIGVDWQGRIETEDVLQEAFIDVFADIATFSYQGVDSFYHWATRIIDHRFVDQVRRLRRRKRDTAREQSPGGARASRHESFFDKHLRDSWTPSRAARREEAVSALLIAIAGLPETYRIVVQRYHLNGEPLSAIASDLGRTEDAVRRLAGRALLRLREALGDASRFLSQFSW